MKVHHLNCGSMTPPTGLRLVCHVLLVEAPTGLLLVDTGFGLQDIARPAERLGPARHVVRPVLDATETAARQVETLGFAREDVRDIVVTHFDTDHIGGLADFPDARVHVTAEEVEGAIRSPGRVERRRFRSAQWSHGPRLVEHTPDGEAWRGFAAATEVMDGVVMMALPGHTRGHAAVAVDAGDRWVLHAGDAFYDHATLEGTRVPLALGLLERLIAHDRSRIAENHRKLMLLHREGDPDLVIASAHDPVLLDRARDGRR